MSLQHHSLVATHIIHVGSFLDAQRESIHLRSPQLRQLLVLTLDCRNRSTLVTVLQMPLKPHVYDVDKGFSAPIMVRSFFSVSPHSVIVCTEQINILWRNVFVNANISMASFFFTLWLFSFCRSSTTNSWSCEACSSNHCADRCLRKFRDCKEGCAIQGVRYKCQTSM